jgi:hypothetical protein
MELFLGKIRMYPASHGPLVCTGWHLLLPGWKTKAVNGEKAILKLSLFFSTVAGHDQIVFKPWAQSAGSQKSFKGRGEVS